MASRIKIQPGDDGRLTVLLPYTPQRVEKIKTISGRRWHAEQKHWTAPNTTGTMERLVSLSARDEVEVDPALHRDWDTMIGDISSSYWEMPKFACGELYTLGRWVAADGEMPIKKTGRKSRQEENNV